MTETTLDASVIICAYTGERWESLAAAVASLRRQTRPPREIILVIDHNAALLERARADMPDSIVIENSEARGLSGARNSGIAVAQGAFIAYLDDDATAEPDWLERLARCCEDPNVLGAGGTVEPLWLAKRPAWFPWEFFWVVGCSYLPHPVGPTPIPVGPTPIPVGPTPIPVGPTPIPVGPTPIPVGPTPTRGAATCSDLPCGGRSDGKNTNLSRPIEVRNPFGGCTCYRRELFETVGGFTNGIGRAGGRPLGCEETELCIRAHQRWPHKVFLYEPLARIHHCVPPPRATWRYFRARCYAEGLSKAAVTRSVGAKDGLASERSYTLRILPRGVMRGLADGILRRDPTGFLRAGAIVVGLLTTAAGYAAGTAAQRLRRPAGRHISIDANTLLHVQNDPDKDREKHDESLYTTR